jgi:CHAD domain-containing protein
MALQYLHALMAEMDGVRQAQDRECVHRMRVASRRLRSVLPLFGPSLLRQTCARWRKQLRRVTRALGAARDTDVQMACVQQFLHDSASPEEHAGVERLLLRLEQRRQAQQGAVVKALERFAARQLGEEMEERLKQVVSQSESYGVDVPGRRVYRQTRKGILKRLNAFEAYAPYVPQPECVKELHAMRIAAKRLRYIMQALAPLYPDELAEPIQAARLCQSRLGAIHDCDVWIDTLPRTRAHAGVFPEQGTLRAVMLWHSRPAPQSPATAGARLPGVCDVLGPVASTGRMGAPASDARRSPRRGEGSG